MKRKPTLAMLISLSATSPLVLALGLGEAEVRSTLNAPLRATIPVIETNGLDPDRVKVSVADERAYSAADLTRTPLARSVRLAMSEREGQLVLDITSERPIREPWLDLLLRFDWPGGQQLREVTLLLDPPDYDAMPSLVVGANSDTSNASPEPDQPAVVRPTLVAEAGDSVRVSSGDTLWSVAGRLRAGSDISMNQRMVALVEANPEVFPTNNINDMRAGHTLEVPSRAAFSGRSAGEAERIVQTMNQAWANRGGGAPTRVALGASAPPASVASADSVSPSSDASLSPGEESATQAAESAVETSSSPEGEGPRLTLLTDAEAAATSPMRAETGGAEGVTEGEDGAAVAEASLFGAGANPVRIAPEVLEALHGEGELSRDARLLRLEARWAESQEALEDVRSERDDLQATLGEMRAELDTLQERLASLSAGGQGAGGVVTADAGSGEAAELPWWRAFYQGGTIRQLMLGGAGLAALLALWALLRHRRRRQQAEEAEASAFANVQVVAPGGGGVIKPETEGRESQTSPVRASMPQAEAINEADIFIAYGRFDQARELLEASLEKEPERDDLRLKLLMVNLQQEDREDAARQAERLRANDDPAVRAEAARLMGQHGESLDPVADDETEPATLDESPSSSRRFTVLSEEVETSKPRSRSEGDGPPVDPPRSEPDSKRTAQPDPPPSSAAEAPPARGKADVEPAMPPEHSPREAEPTSRIIDYKPPPLDPSPVTREETPMQPSVEFTASAGSEEENDAGPDATPTSPREASFMDTLSQKWDVEEVAFPPLDQDNGPLSADASAPASLDEARRLVNADRHEQARALLEPLVEAEDPAIRDEARTLMTRCDP